MLDSSSDALPCRDVKSARSKMGEGAAMVIRCGFLVPRGKRDEIYLGLR
jgi:hypothetical protein